MLPNSKFLPGIRSFNSEVQSYHLPLLNNVEGVTTTTVSQSASSSGSSQYDRDTVRTFYNPCC